MICFLVLDGKNAETIHVIEVFKNLMKLCDTYLFAPKPTKFMRDLQNIIFVPSTIPKFKTGFALFILYQIFLFPFLIYYCFKRNPDIIYVRFSPFIFVPILISKIFQIPIITEVNGLITGETKKSKIPMMRTAVTKIGVNFNYKYSTRIIAVTPGIKKELEKEFRAMNVTVIQNGANIDLFRPIDQNVAKKEVRLAKSRNYVCFVGNFDYYQGVEYLIQATPHILESCPETCFLIIGDGIMKNKWIHLTQKLKVSEKFIFTGVLPYEKVPIYINASNVCVAPFTKERNEKIGLSPLKIYEYLSCGKPVVSSQIPNLDFIGQQDVGILIEPDNSAELAQAIIKLLQDEKLRHNMGEKGRKYVVKNHSWKTVAKKVLKICKDTTNSRVD